MAIPGPRRPGQTGGGDHFRSRFTSTARGGHPSLRSGKGGSGGGGGGSKGGCALVLILAFLGFSGFASAVTYILT